MNRREIMQSGAAALALVMLARLGTARAQTGTVSAEDRHLVVDSGMHAMGWSREKAIAFFTDTIGDPETSAITEVERYCVWPGQACSYMLGKLDWLRLREKAKAALGLRFDIRKFHDAGLLPGAMPLAVLDQCIDVYIAEASTKR